MLPSRGRLRFRTREIALSLGLCVSVSCGTAPPPPAPSPAPPAAPPAASVQEAPDPPPPAPPSIPPELALDEQELAREEKLSLFARDLRDVHGNESPRPVDKPLMKQIWVEYTTDRRSPGKKRDVEAPTMDLHHPPAEVAEPHACADPLTPGTRSGSGGRVDILHTADQDTVRVARRGGKSVPADLPRGALHGACMGPDGTRVWIGLSTPLSPPEIFSVALWNGTVRPLRIEAHPGLAGLPPAKGSSVDEELAVLAPVHPRAAIVLVVERDALPLARWSALARFFAAADVAVVRAAKDDEPVLDRAMAKAEELFHVPVHLVAEGNAAPARARPLVRLLDGTEEERPLSLPPGSTVLGACDRTLPRITRLVAGTDVRWSVTKGDDPRACVARAWARAAAHVLGE
jgi:hypothetical protein